MTRLDSSSIAEALKARAVEEGFALARLTRPDAVPEVAERLSGFIDAGFHGQMQW